LIQEVFVAKDFCDPQYYGEDDTSTATSISSRILGVPEPTLDINSETDSRAQSEGNHGKQGG